MVDPISKEMAAEVSKLRNSFKGDGKRSDVTRNWKWAEAKNLEDSPTEVIVPGVGNAMPLVLTSSDQYRLQKCMGGFACEYAE